MPNQTARRFGHPDTLIRDYEHWLVLLRESQVTIGSLVLCSTSQATAFSQLTKAAFEEMERVVRHIERALAAAFRFDKINYLMLMMSDPNVHFHVIPRYEADRSACGLTIADAGWPAAPRLDAHRELTPSERDALRDHIRRFWPD